MAGFFITGTDTGVGKTCFASLLAHCLFQKRVKVKVCKPVATGAILHPCGNLIADDTLALSQAVSDRDFKAITPFCFEAPVNPALAAKLAGKKLLFQDLVNAVKIRSADNDFIIVEGVGGLLCPLTENETIADLACELNYPLLIIARRSLGTLNHIFLTLEVAKSRGLNIAGVIMSETQPCADLAAKFNPTEFMSRSDVPLLAILPFEADANKLKSREIVAAINWLEIATKMNLKVSHTPNKKCSQPYEKVR